MENGSVTLPLPFIFYREYDGEIDHTRAQYGRRWTDPRR